MAEIDTKTRYLLDELSKGRSLCFSQDGDMAWLYPSNPTEFLDAEYDKPISTLRARKWMAAAGDEHWTEANSFSITDAGRAAAAAPAPLPRG